MDLVSIDIQRGRDHGMPTYNQIRRLCGLQPVKNFRQLKSILSDDDDWEHLSRVYSYVFIQVLFDKMSMLLIHCVFFFLFSHVDDIDFWVAGNLEKPLQEGILGPTFSCIVGEQFRRLKCKWYI